MPAPWILALTFFVTSSTLALAHGTGQHVLGTVIAIDEKQVDVKTTKGGTVSVKLTPQTRFKQKGNAKSAERPAVGDRVVIEASKDNKVLTAIEVHYSAAKNVPAAAQ
jgi:putative ribosome biogenesis GTPase RsgA